MTTSIPHLQCRAFFAVHCLIPISGQLLSSVGTEAIIRSSRPSCSACSESCSRRKKQSQATIKHKQAVQVDIESDRELSCCALCAITTSAIGWSNQCQSVSLPSQQLLIDADLSVLISNAHLLAWFTYFCFLSILVFCLSALKTSSHTRNRTLALESVTLPPGNCNQRC